VRRVFQVSEAATRWMLNVKAGLPPRPELRFNDAGNFTILQIADLHFQVQKSPCRDYDDPDGECDRQGGDVYTKEWLSNVLDLVRPDLVVLTGDQ
jgi:predicted MPP superfamily phosphohydrolase